MVIVNGVVHPVDSPVIPRGFVAWEGETITAVGAMEDLPGGLGETIDAQGGHITPGCIDAHTHLGLFPDSQRCDGNRCNAREPIAPDFDPLEGFSGADRAFAEALAAGVTTVVTGPGSQNPVGGLLACLRTDGRALRAPVGLKMALGETPEETLGTDAAGLLSRLRESLAGAETGALAAAKGGGLPVHVHVHRASDIAAALELAAEFGLKLVLLHGTEAPSLAGAIAAAGVPVITGPGLTDRSRPELERLCPEIPALLIRGGVKAAICTDHPETPAQFLPLCAALAVRGGLDREEALRAITLTPAEILGLDGRAGSLTPGKTADVVVTPGSLFDPTVKPSAVILGGRRVV